MEFVLWEMNLRTNSLEARMAAARSGGFDVLSMSYGEWLRAGRDGHTAETLVCLAQQYGIRLDFLDGVTSWTPARFNKQSPDFMREAFDFGSQQAFDLCSRLGMKNITAFAGFASGTLTFSEQVSFFGAFCDEAAERNISVQLEGVPFFGEGIPTLADAWAIVREADRPNASVMFDTWHFFRRGADIDMLAAIPRGKIKHVQLVDGTAFQRLSDSVEDARHDRELPGCGEMPLTYIIKLLRSYHDIETFGPEATAERGAKLSPEQFGIEAKAAIDRTISW